MKKIRFDTLDKKPKLYNLAILTAFFTAAVVIMALIDAKGLAVPICITVSVCLGLAIAALVNAFIAQLRYNPYSYNTIYYIGFALFLISILVTNCVLLFRMTAHPEEYGATRLVWCSLLTTI